MVEFAAAALTSMATTAGTVAAPLELAGATGAASAGTGLLSSLATPSLLGSVLQGGAGLLSSFAAIRAGQAQKEGLLQQANAADLDAGQQKIIEATKENSLKSQLVATLGQRDVAYGASGVDLSFGTPAAARSQAIVDAGSALGTDEADNGAVTSQLRARAAAYRAQAADAAAAGDTTATGTLLTTGARLLMRG